MTEEIYKPPGSESLDTDGYLVQIRLGIQGFPKTGKSFSAVTFPNPIVLSYDRGLVSHVGRKDIIEIPFYKDEFINKLVTKEAPMYTDLRDDKLKVRPANRKDALPLWLATEGVKLKQNQTLIIDGSTGIQAAFHQQYWTNPKVTDAGKVDKWGEWNWKIDYFTEIMMYLKALQCNVIYICHEARDRDEKGELNGKLKPLIRGSFVDELQSHFTDWYRALTFPKPKPDKLKEFQDFFKLDATQTKEWLGSSTNETIYVWQTCSDEKVECGTSLVGAPKYVLAKYETFSKYKRQIKQ